MFAKYFLYWLPLPFIAILNGLVREYVYGKSVSELAAHQISTAVGIILFSLYLWWLSSYWSLTNQAQAVTLGCSWLVLTLAFEFGFGHFVAGHPWSRLLHDYNLLAGRVWILIPIWSLIAPVIAMRLRAK
ncbi:MAG: hypothetical protein H6695_12950 [Deferribacteres bacterium]|nr:hypothetical protein [candidate division KSB1 bacterium]MCB9511092.1 hypothetical protein [Deferribacteres bacterium]